MSRAARPLAASRLFFSADLESFPYCFLNSVTYLNRDHDDTTH